MEQSITDLVQASIEVKTCSELIEKFTQAELEAIIEYHMAQKKILAKKLLTEKSVVERVRINKELDSIRFELHKINENSHAVLLERLNEINQEKANKTDKNLSQDDIHAKSVK